MTTAVGTGATVEMPAAWGSVWYNEIRQISRDGPHRKSIPTSHLGTTVADTFIPSSRYDPGTVRLELNFQDNEAPPLGAAAVAGTLTITTPSSGSTWAASSFATDFNFEIPDEERMDATCEIKLSGAETVA